MSARPALLFVLALALTACAGGGQGRVPGGVATVAGGDPGRGSVTIGRAQCGACHIIPGIADAHGLVGPPLIHFGRRTMVAGFLPNTPDALQHWLLDPQGVAPGNGMPATGLSQAEARDAAAYLESLR